MFEHEDDDLASAIYGQQASVTPPQPTMSMTGTPGASPSQTPAPTPQGGPSSPPPPPAALGGDIFAGIYGGQQPQTMASLAAPAGGADLKGGAPTPGGQAQAGDRVATYRDAVSRISQASDPAAKARETDSLARGLYADLQAAGRTVKWEGDTMIVDGRRYTLGSAATNTTPGGIEIPNDFPHDGELVDSQDPIAAGVQGGATGGAPAGFDPAKWGTGHGTAKYAITEALVGAGVQDQLRAIPDEAGRKAFMESTLRGMAAQFEAAGAQLLDVKGEKVLIQTADRGPHWIDTVQDIEGGAALQWIEPGGGDAPGGPGVMGIDSLGAAGLPTGGGPGAMPPPPAAAPGWSPTGPTYTPGEITVDDIPDFTTEGLAAQMGGYTPERYEVGDMGVGAAEGDVDALMRSILANPESLGADDIERLKVSGREEAADMERMDMDELTGLGYETGNESAPWLASQKLARRGQTSEAVARNNRNVDIEAARTNAGDRRAAAALGSSHLAEVGSRKRGEEALRQGGAKLNADNAFNSAKLKSDNVTNAAKLSLDAASERGDRMALRESVNQAAAELGISRDKLMLDYVTSTRDDLTRRYGIDVDAALKQQGIAVDWATLSQRGSEFQQELAFKMRQLALQHEVDMTGLGLGYDTLEQRANEADMDFLSRGIYG